MARLVPDWREFVALARAIKRDMMPEWEPVLIGGTFLLAVDTDYDKAFKVDYPSLRQDVLDMAYAGSMVSGANMVLGMLDREDMQVWEMELEELTREYPGWQRVMEQGG